MFRVGQGWDVHRLTPGGPLRIGGIDIPWEKHLLGHSDADVVLHAVTDALLGAIAAGDIGTHFPDTDPQHRGVRGIPILGYHWMPNSVWRTPEPATLRGGAKGTRFNLAEHDPNQLTHARVYSAEEMWENYVYYMSAILPVAEESGVKLALHPDDPPVESLGGVARIFGSFEGFKRGMDTFDSPNHGLDFCMGCWSEMGGHNYVIDAIRHFGARGKLIYIHFRDVQGTVPNFNECFIDEGNVDTLAVMQTLKEVGFDGFMITDHVPAMVDDTPWGHRGRAYAIGYMTALLQVVNRAA
ncbi:MAG: hypothetical protein HC802_22610 [Caldilineaceae bacterium]|nr:hypothetical protein [Caldilineaceae bacterium]